MKQLILNRRILFLCSDPIKIEAQLNGENLALDGIGSLRDDVSTDEITPIPTLAYYDHRLGQYPYTGLKSGTHTPITKGRVQQGQFNVTIAGKRYGKGSSREHSPIAEYQAGIRLVIAESFERIYRQNADNIGLFTSTDFNLITRIQHGEVIDIEELIADRDKLTADILRHGGLLHYAPNRVLATVNEVHMPTTKPQTYFEKILSRHWIGPEAPIAGTGGFVKTDWRFIHEYYTGMCMHMLCKAFMPPINLFNPSSIIAFEDHLSYMNRSPAHLRQNLIPSLIELLNEHRRFVAQYGVISHGCLNEGEGSEGISHALMIEKYSLPGQIVVGTDSHTPHGGAIGSLSFGVGTTDMANSMVTGTVRMTVPESIRVELAGTLQPGVNAKDIALQLLAHPRIKAGAGIGKVFEFCGGVIRALNTDDRATLTNMCAELGGMTGLIVPDGETVHFLSERRGIYFALEPWMHSDLGACYTEQLFIDCTHIEPMVAAPGDPGNGLALSTLLKPIKVDIAYGGSCTAGKREDFDQYYAVLEWATSQGLQTHPDVKFYLQFGTIAVRNYCIERGYLTVFTRAGAELLQPACGACANCGPGSSTRSDQTTVSASNRNFPGRSGPGNVWLASPQTVAASAIAGELISFAQLRRRFETQTLAAAVQDGI